MIKPTIEPEENVFYENESVILTNERLIAKSLKKKSIERWTETKIGDLFSPKKENGGKQGKLYLGGRMASAGIIMILVQMVPYYLLDMNLVRSLGGFVENLLSLIHI